jgi:hypothetical protein
MILRDSTLCSAKVLSKEDSKFADLVLLSIVKSSFLHFKVYNLAINVTNSFKINSTHYFSSSKKDVLTPKGLSWL